MNKLKLILPIVLFSLTISAQNQPKDIADTFFNDYKEKGADVALDNLYKTNNWISRNGDAVTQLKSQMMGLSKDFIGEYYGKELILEKRLSDSYILLSYLVKYDRQPLRFTFQFYKPNGEWRIQSFSYDGDIDDEIVESAKLYHFRLN